MVAQPRSEHTLVKKRLEIVFLMFLLLVLVLALRLTALQSFQSRGFVELADRMQGRTVPIVAKRGRVLDRSGAEFATDNLAKAVVMNPRVVKDTAETSTRLAELLSLGDEERAAIRGRLLRGRERNLAYSQLRRPVDRKLAEQLFAVSKSDPRLKGLWLEDYPIRVNPGGRDGIQLIGQVGSDRHGKEGFELKFDRVLGGKNGLRYARVDATGTPIPGSENRIEEPEHGKDLRLTLDRDIQHFVEEELRKVAEAQTPDAATAVVMDTRNGDVLAMANWPTYSPEDKKITPAQRRNRAVTDLFEPGSIFKVITGSAALEAGIQTKVHCSGSRAIGNRSVHCAHGSHGAVDMRRMVEQSCNIAAGSYAERVGPARMYDFLDKMGLQSKTGIEFPGEEYGRMLAPEKWRTMRTVNIGFGQGIVVTPIQLVAAYAAIANDGIYNPPRLVLDAPDAQLPERKARRVMSPANAARMRACMEAVVTDGTGKSAKIAGYSCGGKTGTAQIAKNGTYGHGYVASFVGVVPVSKPRLAILVSVWHPRRGHYGGVVSAPVFREIARQSTAFLRIPPDAPNDLRDGGDRATFARYVTTGGGGGND